jgi:hypothetical protein
VEKKAMAEAALSRKATNAVGRKGPDRMEWCEVFDKWRARLKDRLGDQRGESC